MFPIRLSSRRLFAILACTALLLPSAAATPRPAEAADCFFEFGFKALHDLMPTIVGDCLDNESHNPENGDGLQPTAGGLLVWRKADNWTAFTNGTITWINGPQGLQSRGNNDRFPWEAAAPAPAPVSAPPPPASAAPPPAAATPPPAAASGPITKSPAEIALGLGDVGKEITQKSLKNDSDNRSKWAEIRFERGDQFFGKRFGPLKIVNRVYVANDVPSAQAIYKDEVSKQTKMPEAEDKVGTVYPNVDKDAVQQVGDEQDSRGACNDDCNSKETKYRHQRTVMRYQNAVTVLYFWGDPDAASPTQIDEWLPKLRERMSS